MATIEGVNEKEKGRDIEKGYMLKQMVAKLRRLADCQDINIQKIP